MNKVYIVVDACSGEDYSADEPNILLITTDKKKAEEFFDDEISNWEDGMTNFENDFSKCEDGVFYMCYECTDYDGDSHRILKLTEHIID